MKLGTNYSDQQQTLGIAKRSNVTVWLGYHNHGYDPYASMNLSSSKEKEQDIRKSVNFLQNNLVVIDEIPLVQGPHSLTTYSNSFSPTLLKKIVRSFPSLHLTWISQDKVTFETYLNPVIGKENTLYPLNQSDTKFKPTTTWSPAFSRALGSWLVFTLSSH